MSEQQKDTLKQGRKHLLTNPFTAKQWSLIAFSIVLIGVLGAAYIAHRLQQPFLTPERLAELRTHAAQQNETALATPPTRAAIIQPQNRQRNAYFGDLHVHSNLSFDSYIFGNRFTVDEAYRFARGQAFTIVTGEKMQLTRPLDFAAITDHAEGFGLHEACTDDNKSNEAVRFCTRFDNPTAGFFLELRESGQKRPMVPLPLAPPEKMAEFSGQTWAHIVAMADQHNEPGHFTTFAAYEYSPPLPDRGKIHRNVIFRNNTVPGHAVSAYDADTEIDLWRALAQNCTQPCAVITIPHNPNKSWGLAFAGITIDGDVYQPDDWLLRDRYEPIVEMFQIKGNSECALGIATNDEACRFEQFLPPCEKGQKTGCITPTSMARDGLKKGLLLDSELGFNPLDFGMIGSTDTHNSNPGDVEEWDFRGAAAGLSSPAHTRLLAGERRRKLMLELNPGGLAAIWATENTRAALFDAMQRKEVYATSGTRIRLRFFGGFNDLTPLASSNNPVAMADTLAVPMGASLPADGKDKPEFFVWAMRDPDAAALDKVQIIKSWVDGGVVHERVVDIVCSGARVPDANNQCPATKASVNLTNCAPDTQDDGAELKAVWRDTRYKSGQQAFYYARTIQNPSCRWSSYDSLRLAITPPDTVPSLVTEMAWSSPIWIGGRAKQAAGGAQGRN